MYPLLRKVEQKENRLVGAKPYLRDSLKIYNSDKLNCVSCDGKIPIKCINKKLSDGLIEVEIMSLCSFCRGRNKKMKRLKQQITNLQYELFLLAGDFAPSRSPSF